MPFMKCGIIKLYCTYVDNTLVLLKEDQIDKILKPFIHLWFTVEIFENEDVHFLDMKIMNDGEATISIKETNYGLYINNHNYQTWDTKTPWIRELYDKAQKT